MRTTLAGYVHLARMIDKCRAVLAGTQGEYVYPCPIDERLLECAGITSEGFTDAVKSFPTDEAVVAWFLGTAKRHEPGEVAAWNEQLLACGPGSADSVERFKTWLNAADSSRTDITAWADLQDLEEGRALPRR
jgi:hypothetical protein